MRKVKEYPAWDVNPDGTVGNDDLIIVSRNFGIPTFSNPRADVNGDGTVDIKDLMLVAEHFGESTPLAAPTGVVQPVTLDPKTVPAWIDRAHAENDESITFARGSANLERLLAAIPPAETTLLANYPNPFNPGTWIP